LGLNDINYRSSPVQIGSLTTWSSSVTIPCTIKTDGTLWAWGYNGSGQLGLGDAIDRSSPVQIGSLTTWSVYSGIPGYTGFTHSSSLALKTDGTIWAWGNNTYGQLGLGDTINRSSPVQVGSLTTWSIIALGGSKGGSDGVRASAIKTDGTLWIWGSNSFGSLGLGNTIKRSSPTQVGALTTWLQLSVGSAVMAAIKS
jgi:alpha-tubulin suppressor-like RCC1 family protein